MNKGHQQNSYFVILPDRKETIAWKNEKQQFSCFLFMSYKLLKNSDFENMIMLTGKAFDEPNHDNTIDTHGDDCNSTIRKIIQNRYFGELFP